jgi:hypothetical protein
MWFLVLRFSSTASLLTDSFGRSSKCSSRHAETKKMFDIKDAPADNLIGDWWKYVLIVALILGIGVLIYWFIKNVKRKITSRNL